MSEEEKNQGVEREGEQSVSPRGETLPNHSEMGDMVEPPIGEPRLDASPETGATVRYRSRKTHLRMVGIACAVFILLAAILVACMIAGSGGTEMPSETTGETDSGAESESGEVIDDLYRFDPSVIPEGHIAFRPMDLSGDAGTVVNDTDLAPDLEALLSRYRADGGAEAPSATFSEPLVLILHTHTTEGYSAAGALSWDGNGDLARSENGAENVIAVGAVLADALNALGIPTIHCEVYHDTVDGVGTNSGSYDRAKETIGQYLAEYPSVKYVLDLHRDTVTDENGNLVRAVTMSEGTPVAQIMAVVGGGADEAWEDNLALALALTETLNGTTPALCRAPTLKSSALNQELSAHALSLEIGTAANSLAEAEAAARLLAGALAGVIQTVESKG